jgi:hypothetical protein
MITCNQQSIESFETQKIGQFKITEYWIPVSQTLEGDMICTWKEYILHKKRRKK